MEWVWWQDQAFKLAARSALLQKIRPRQRHWNCRSTSPKACFGFTSRTLNVQNFRIIDFHTHISGSTRSENGVELSPDREYLGTPQELLAVMDRKNIRAMVNLTGGYDNGLAEAVAKYDRAYPGRFYTFTEP